MSALFRVSASLFGFGAVGAAVAATSPTVSVCHERDAHRKQEGVASPDHGDRYYPIHGATDPGLPPAELARYEVHPDGRGGIYQRRGTDGRPVPPPPGRYKYVSRTGDDGKPKLYLNTPEPMTPGARGGVPEFFSSFMGAGQPRHHTDFLGGAVPVTCAGFMEVAPAPDHAGVAQITIADNNSGHIQVPEEGLQSAVVQMQRAQLLRPDVKVVDATWLARLRGNIFARAESITDLP